MLVIVGGDTPSLPVASSGAWRRGHRRHVRTTPRMKTRPSRGASECTSFIRRVPEAIWAARDRKLEEASRIRVTYSGIRVAYSGACRPRRRRQAGVTVAPSQSRRGHASGRGSRTASVDERPVPRGEGVGAPDGQRRLASLEALSVCFRRELLRLRRLVRRDPRARTARPRGPSHGAQTPPGPPGAARRRQPGEPCSSA